MSPGATPVMLCPAAPVRTTVVGVPVAARVTMHWPDTKENPACWVSDTTTSARAVESEKSSDHAAWPAAFVAWVTPAGVGVTVPDVVVRVIPTVQPMPGWAFCPLTSCTDFATVTVAAVGATAVTVAEPGSSTPDGVTLEGPFVYEPTALVVTVISNVQLATFVAREPVNVTDVEPAVAPEFEGEAHVVRTFGVGATVRPAGKALTKLKPGFAPSSDVLVTVNVRREVPPTVNVAGESATSSCGVTSSSRMLSMEASLPLPLPLALRMRMPVDAALTKAAAFEV